MKPADIHTFFETLRALNPHPQSDLKYTNPFTLLVAVVLSAQTTDKGVNKATASLFPKIDTPEKIIALGEDALKEHLKTLSFYKTKAKNVIALSKKLLKDYGGEVPRTREDLTTLPGVGRKTANVVLNIVYGEPTMAVDTHVFRVSNRTGLAPGKTPEEVEEKLLKVVPKEFGHHAHHWLILHGRYVCKARKPNCPDCAVRAVCQFRSKTKA